MRHIERPRPGETYPDWRKRNRLQEARRESVYARGSGLGQYGGPVTGPTFGGRNVLQYQNSIGGVVIGGGNPGTGETTLLRPVLGTAQKWRLSDVYFQYGFKKLLSHGTAPEPYTGSYPPIPEGEFDVGYDAFEEVAASETHGSTDTGTEIFQTGSVLDGTVNLGKSDGYSYYENVNVIRTTIPDPDEYDAFIRKGGFASLGPPTPNFQWCGGWYFPGESRSQEAFTRLAIAVSDLPTDLYPPEFYYYDVGWSVAGDPTPGDAAIVALKIYSGGPTAPTYLEIIDMSVIDTFSNGAGGSGTIRLNDHGFEVDLEFGLVLDIDWFAETPWLENPYPADDPDLISPKPVHAAWPEPQGVEDFSDSLAFSDGAFTSNAITITSFTVTPK